MTPQQKAELLSRAAIFRGLDTDTLLKLASQARERSIAAGDILFAAGDTPQGLFVVVRGAVRAVRVNLEGREQTIHVETEGGMLAEVAVLDGGPYPSTAIAETDAEILFLASADVLEFLLQHPPAALQALRMMASRLRQVSGLAERLALHDVGQRLASLLLETATKTRPQLRNGDSFSLPLSHSQIASRLGSVREVVTRSLQRMVQQNAISIHGHRITVTDLEQLQKIADQPRSLHAETKGHD